MPAGRVRGFEERDVLHVTELHRRVFPALNGHGAPPEAYHAYFREIFLTNPLSGGESPSLVYEEGGDVVGFLGVIHRQMSLRGQPVRMATSSQFIVDPGRRATLAGIELVRALLAGPQDFTLADEAIDLTRRLWEGLGGATVPLYSLSWVRVLRPFEFAVRRWGGGRRLASAWLPASHLADAVATRLPGTPFRPPASALRGEELDGEALAACLAEFPQDRALRPAYDGRAAAWLLEILARKPGSGPLRKTLVRDAGGEIAGWYLYAATRGGIAEVIQLGAREGSIGAVLDHLSAQAWRDGIVGLIGRLDPRSVGEFTARRCFFHHRGYWTLVHARDPRVLTALQRGDAFVTRLEGEWCLRFQVGAA